MKITLSREELLNVLSRQFGYTVTDYVISKAPSSYYVKIEQAFAKQLGVSGISFACISGANKINAIKALRQVVSDIEKTVMGLAEAKWAVENWQQWSDFVKTNGRPPVFQGEMFTLPGPKLI